MRRLFLIGLVTVLVGCSARVREDHYFQSVSRTSGLATNYFRLRVTGESDFSRSRYIAGYYDERAVDLYFNELKRAESGTLFTGDSLKLEGETIKPLAESPKNGAFVMILSTQAKPVSDAIGAFAENQIVADAITNIVNHKDVEAVRKAGATLDTANARALSVKQQLDAAAATLDAGSRTATPPVPPTSPVSAGQTTLRMLQIIGAELGAPHFGTPKEASDWFLTTGVAK